MWLVRRIMKIKSINPANGETLKTYDEMTPAEAASAVGEAHDTWTSWRKITFAERGAADEARSRDSP